MKIRRPLHLTVLTFGLLASALFVVGCDDRAGEASPAQIDTLDSDSFLSDASRTDALDACQRALAIPCEEAIATRLNPVVDGRAQFFGETVLLSDDTLVIGVPGDASDATGINGDMDNAEAPESGAVYVFVRDGGGDWLLQAYLKASNAERGDGFGRAIAFSGDTLAVSAWFEDSAATSTGADPSDNSAQDSGAVYVFERDDQGQWSQTAYLKGDRDTARFGFAMALDGDTLAVSAPFDSKGLTPDGAGLPGSGAVHVFAREQAGTWQEEAFLKASDARTGAGFGLALDLRNNTLVIGAPSTPDPINNGEQNPEEGGAVYVFSSSDTRWQQEARLTSEFTKWDDEFGASVAFDGRRLAVGAPGESSPEGGINPDLSFSLAPDSGTVFLFEQRQTGVWQASLHIKSAQADAGDRFGTSLAFDGRRLIVGAPDESSRATGINGDESDNSAPLSGAVYVFDTGSNGAWSQRAYIKAPNNAGAAKFGGALSADKGDLAIGAPFEPAMTGDAPALAGAVYVQRIAP